MMFNYRRVVTAFVSCAMLILSNGCRTAQSSSCIPADTAVSARAQTADLAQATGSVEQATDIRVESFVSPEAETAAPLSVEEKVLALKGIEMPFDYSLRQNAIDAGMVVICGDEQIYNKPVLQQFMDQYQNGMDCCEVIVWYAGEELLDVHALLYQGGVLTCESITDTVHETFNISSLTTEQGSLYGMLEGGQSMVLAVNAGEDAQPVDLSEETSRLAGVLDCELRWFTVLASPDLSGENRARVNPGQVDALMQMLSAEPIYLFEDVKDQHTAARNLDIRLTLTREGDRMTLMPQTDGSVLIGDGAALYVTDNETLFEIILGMIGLKEFHMSDVGEVKAITLKYRDAGGTNRDVSVEDGAAISKISAALGSAAIGQSRMWFDPDVEMVLSTDSGDVVCRLIGSARPEAPEDEIVINGFYWFESAEVVRLIRELLS